LSLAKSLRKAYEEATVGGGDPRIMLINSPSNPTGQVYDRAAIITITTFCREQKITLISDEIYSDISFSGDTVPSPAARGQLDDSQIILTGGLSKVNQQHLRLSKALTPSDIFGWWVESRFCHLPCHRLRVHNPKDNPRLCIRMLVRSLCSSPSRCRRGFRHDACTELIPRAGRYRA
jgi:hypothetical protein